LTANGPLQESGTESSVQHKQEPVGFSGQSSMHELMHTFEASVRPLSPPPVNLCIKGREYVLRWIRYRNEATGNAGLLLAAMGFSAPEPAGLT
jgi:hypothetical protein